MSRLRQTCRSTDQMKSWRMVKSVSWGGTRPGGQTFARTCWFLLRWQRYKRQEEASNNTASWTGDRGIMRVNSRAVWSPVFENQTLRHQCVYLCKWYEADLEMCWLRSFFFFFHLSPPSALSGAAVESWRIFRSWLPVWGLCHYGGSVSS